MKARLTRTTVGLAVGITAAVAAACAIGAYVYSVHHFAALLQVERSTSRAEAELVRDALEHQMIENDRSLIARIVSSFGTEPGVASVMVLDRRGAVRFAGGPVPPTDLALGSPTCQACHHLPAAQRGSSRVIETRGGTVLRTVVPIHNRAACYSCHDPAHRINGIVIFDRDVGATRAEMNRDLRWLVASSGGIALVLIALIALVVRLVVLRRLQRFETTARLIAGGDLERRVPATGRDTISWLAREFNAMADSITGLLHEVRSERGRLETVINSIDDGIVVLDATRRIVAANDAFLQRTGQSRHQVVGVCCAEAKSGRCNVADCPTLACLASSERQVRICERRTADGTTVCEEVHASPIRGEGNQIVRVVEVWRDISDRRAAEARLAESHRLASLGLLASGFSHEMNTPLGTVLACVEGILRDAQRGEMAPADATEQATIAREQILRCRSITQQFLRMSRGQASGIDIVDAASAAAAVARLVDPTAHAHSVTIALAPPDGDARVRADEGQLQQAIFNLLLNAVQASPAGGVVAVEVRTDPDVRIRVSDNGCGIEPEQQKRIFEPFYSIRQGGTGLGLFLSLNFVRAWGGDIVLDSAPGRGATFEIVLPSIERENLESPRVPPPLAEKGGELRRGSPKPNGEGGRWSESPRGN